jgi:multidrug efflux pump subunit AcrB
MGKDKVRAAREGTAEITFAALAATLAVVAIFIPVVFMKGIVGKFFLQFGVTLCTAVLLSYLEAITLAPARCAQLLTTSREHRSRIGLTVDRGFTWLEGKYRLILERALAKRRLILGGAALLFIGAILVLRALPAEFVPSQDQSRLMVRMQTAVGSDLTETDRIFQQAEAVTMRHPEIRRTFAVVGGGGGSGVNSGIMFLTLSGPHERKESQQEFAATIRKQLNAIPGLRAVVQDPSQQGFTARRGFPVEFSVRGSDWNRLVELSGDVMQDLQATGTVVDLDTDYQVGMPELRIFPDRARCADLGIAVEDVASAINAMVGGVNVGKYTGEGGRRMDVRMRLLAGQRSRPEDIQRLHVRTASGELVPLSSVVTTEERPALQAITRLDRERAITITANVAPGHSQEQALAKVTSLSRNLPVGYRLVLGGASVAFKESMGSLLFALVLGLAVAYMVLASQFNSFLNPLTVLTILPLSIAGAAAGLAIAGKSLNIFSMIGLLLLLGISKKNSIILVDYGRQMREEGKNARDAMLIAGPRRLRPILMTSVATLMAAVPPALGLGPGSEIRTPMAIAVIGGLVVSTALSLIVVPTFFVTADAMAVRVRERLRVRREQKVLKRAGSAS